MNRNLNTAQFNIEQHPGGYDDEAEFLAVHQGKPVGRLAMITPDPEWGERGYVQHLDVPEAHRGKGVASALMDHARNTYGDQIGYTLGEDKPDGFKFLQAYHNKTGWIPGGKDREPAFRDQGFQVRRT